MQDNVNNRANANILKTPQHYPLKIPTKTLTHNKKIYTYELRHFAINQETPARE